MKLFFFFFSFKNEIFLSRLLRKKNNKTKLKGDDTDAGLYLYTKSKNMLNSVYGMSATDPIHQEILYMGGDYKRSSYDTMTKDEIDKALKSAPFPYQWGVY